MNKLESKGEIKGYQKEIKHLQKENEILKENAEHNDKVVDKAKWNEMIYKSRIDKAIEYIKENSVYKNKGYIDESIKTTKYFNLKTLLEILDKENE